MAEKYVKVVEDMYEDSVTTVKYAVGMTEGFKVEVGLHQESALSSFLFAMVMDRLTDEVRQESPWNMMFVENVVICSESKEQMKRNLERWRYVLERRGMKVSRSKTEYMCVNERGDGEMVLLQGVEVPKVKEFRYLGSTVQCNGGCGSEVKRMVQAGWNNWWRVSGVIYDRRLSACAKGKVVMLHGLETVPLTKKQEAELAVAELKMLRFALRVTRMHKIKNEFIRGTAHIRQIGDEVREARLRWYGHVQRRNTEYVGKRMLCLELSGKRRRGRPKTRFMDVVREDMRVVGVSDRDTTTGRNWRLRIQCGDP